MTGVVEFEVLDLVFYLVFNPEGRITGGGSMYRSSLQQQISVGGLLVQTELDVGSNLDLLFQTEAERWIDPSQRFMLSRPIIDWGFDQVEIPPMQEAVLANIPPCTVSFTGPVNGTQAHETLSDLSIGFRVPGTYTVTFEAFPYRPASFTLEVKA